MIKLLRKVRYSEIIKTIFDNFWVEQSSIPPKSVLIVFVAFHIIALIISTLFYRQSKSRIIESVSGPNRKYQLQRPKKLLFGMKLTYIGAILVIFDNLLTHFVAIFVNPDRGYFSIGASSIFSPIAVALTITGISLFFHDLFALPKNRMNSMYTLFNLIRFQILVFFLYILTTIVLFDDANFRSKLLLSSGFLLVGLTFTEIYLINKNEYFLNKLLKLRFYGSMMFGIGFMFVTLVTIFYLPNTNPSEQWHTRNPEVDLFLFMLDFWVVYNLMLIFLLVNVPSWLKNRFGIKNEEYLLYSDERIDFRWEMIKSSYLLHQFEQGKPRSTQNTDQYIMFYNDNLLGRSKYLLNIAPHFKSDVILRISSFDDSFFQENILENSNLFYMTHQTNNEMLYIVNYVESEFNFFVDIDENIIVNDFEYRIEGFSCGFIIIVPSPWNFSKKIWLVYAPSTVVIAISELLEVYYEYFNDISDEEAIFCVVKFPLKGIRPINIPSSLSDRQIPEPRNLIFL